MIDPFDPREIGQRLQLTRQALGLAQNDFAAKAGISPSAYNHYEGGRHRPSLEAARALRQAYGLTLDWIYEGDPSGLRYGLADSIKALRSSRGQYGG